jgi:antitoxin CptB
VQSDERPRELERLRWRCRRGLLELDLYLSRFVDTHLDRLDAGQRAAFVRLLDLPDNDLWDLIAGRQPAPDEEAAAILAMLR